MGKVPGPWTTNTITSIIPCTLLHLGLTFPVLIFPFSIWDMFPHCTGCMLQNDLTIFWKTNSKTRELCWQPLPDGTWESSVVAPQGSASSGLCWRGWAWMGFGLLLVQLRALPASSRQLEPEPGMCEAGIHIINPGTEWVGHSKEEEAAPQKWENCGWRNPVFLISWIVLVNHVACVLLLFKKAQPVPSDVWNLWISSVSTFCER